MAQRSSGRPQGDPSRRSQRLRLDEDGRRDLRETLAAVSAAEALMPSLADQFAALDARVGQAVFRLLEVIGEQTPQQRLESRVLANGVRSLDGVSTEFADLMAAVDGLIFGYGRVAGDAADEESLAARFLEDYAVNRGEEVDGGGTS